AQCLVTKDVDQRHFARECCFSKRKRRAFRTFIQTLQYRFVEIKRNLDFIAGAEHAASIVKGAYLFGHTKIENTLAQFVSESATWLRENRRAEKIVELDACL